MDSKDEICKEEEPIFWTANKIALGCFLLILSAVAYYLYRIVFPELPECIGRWDEEKCLIDSLVNRKAELGQLGDFLGGLINPIIVFVTVILLLRSHHQTEKALKISNSELIATRNAVDQATKAQEEMKKSLEIQIIEAKGQNNFGNYFKHLDEFTKHMESFVSFSDVTIEYRRLHKYIFPACINGEYNPDVAVQEKFDRVLADVFLQFMLLDSNDWVAAAKVSKRIEELISAFQIDIHHCVSVDALKKHSNGEYISGLKYFVKIGEMEITFSVDNVIRHISSLILLIKCFDHALKFKINGDMAYYQHSDALFIMENHFAAALRQGKWGNINQDGKIDPWMSLMKIAR
ncbi:hypothetical protein [Cellvibrio sp.]